MRTRVTGKAWFGPKRQMGWGWTPASWEGWVCTAVFAALIIAAASAWHGVSAGIAVVVLVLAFVALILLTGDPPGGPGARTRD